MGHGRSRLSSRIRMIDRSCGNVWFAECEGGGCQTRCTRLIWSTKEENVMTPRRSKLFRSGESHYWKIAVGLGVFAAVLGTAFVAFAAEGGLSKTVVSGGPATAPDKDIKFSVVGNPSNLILFDSGNIKVPAGTNAPTTASLICAGLKAAKLDDFTVNCFSTNIEIRSTKTDFFCRVFDNFTANDCTGNGAPEACCTGPLQGATCKNHGGGLFEGSPQTIRGLTFTKENSLVPVMSEWGLMILGLLLFTASVYFWKRTA